MSKLSVTVILAAAAWLRPALSAAAEADLDGMVSNFAVGGINNGVILPELNNALAGLSGDGAEALNTAVGRYVAFLDIASKVKDEKYSEASISVFMTAYGEYVSAVAAAGAIPVWLPGPSYIAALVATIQFAGEMRKAALAAGIALEDDAVFSSLSMDRGIAAYGQAIPADDGTLLKIYLRHYLSGKNRSAIEKFLSRTAGFRLDFSEGDEKYKTYPALSAGGSFSGTLTNADLGPADKYVIGLLGGLVRKANEQHKSVEAAHKAEVELGKQTKELGRLSQIYGSMPMAIQHLKGVEKIKPRIEGWKKLPAEAGAMVAKAQALMKVENPAESPRELCANARNKVSNAITGLQMTGLEPGLLKELQAKYPSILSQCGKLGDELDALEAARQEKAQRKQEEYAHQREAAIKSRFDYAAFASGISYSGPNVPAVKDLIDELDSIVQSGEVPNADGPKFAEFSKRISLLQSDYNEAAKEFYKKMGEAGDKFQNAMTKDRSRIQQGRKSCEAKRKDAKSAEDIKRIGECLEKAGHESDLDGAAELYGIKMNRNRAAMPGFGTDALNKRIDEWRQLYRQAQKAVENPGGGMDSAEQALSLIGVRLDKMSGRVGSPFPSGYWTSEGVVKQISEEEGCQDSPNNYEHECVKQASILAKRWAEDQDRAQSSLAAAKAAQTSYQSKLKDYLSGVERDLSEIKSQLKSVTTSAEGAAKAVAATPWFKKEAPGIAERIKELMDRPERLSQRLQSAKQEGSNVAATMRDFEAAVPKAAAHAEELANAHAAMKKILEEPTSLSSDEYYYLKHLAEGGDKKKINQVGFRAARKQELLAELNKRLSRIPDWARAHGPKFAKHLKEMIKVLDKENTQVVEVGDVVFMNRAMPALPAPAVGARLDAPEPGSKQPDASAMLQKVRDLYRDFAAAFQGRNAGAVTGMLSSDWQAPDGSGPAQAREALGAAFKTFSRVEFRLSGLKVAPRPDGTFEASYSAVIVGQLPGAEIPHEESFSATEIVAWEDGKPLIKKTVRTQ